MPVRGLVVRAFACEAGRLDLILSWVTPKTKKMVSAASLALTLSILELRGG